MERRYGLLKKLHPQVAWIDPPARTLKRGARCTVRQRHLSPVPVSQPPWAWQRLPRPGGHVAAAWPPTHRLYAPILPTAADRLAPPPSAGVHPLRVARAAFTSGTVGEGGVGALVDGCPLSFVSLLNGRAGDFMACSRDVSSGGGPAVAAKGVPCRCAVRRRARLSDDPLRRGGLTRFWPLSGSPPLSHCHHQSFRAWGLARWSGRFASSSPAAARAFMGARPRLLARWFPGSCPFVHSSRPPFWSLVLVEPPTLASERRAAAPATRSSRRPGPHRTLALHMLLAS